MKDKIGIIVGLGIVCAVIVTLAFYIFNAGNLALEEYLLIIIPIILVASAVFLLWDRIKNVNAGLPAKDERLIKIGYRAGYYGFIAAIWSAVGTNLGYNIIFDAELRGGLVVAAVVLVSGIVFMISYIYFSMKGN